MMIDGAILIPDALLLAGGLALLVGAAGFVLGYCAGLRRPRSLSPYDRVLAPGRARLVGGRK